MTEKMTDFHRLAEWQRSIDRLTGSVDSAAKQGREAEPIVDRAPAAIHVAPLADLLDELSYRLEVGNDNDRHRVSSAKLRKVIHELLKFAEEVEEDDPRER